MNPNFYFSDGREYGVMFIEKNTIDFFVFKYFPGYFIV